ncbi:uncharacterized protein BDZ99DRAFT_403879 [Mytilinidion resinicola]|uniref:Extracellular membrane protein CFEM domain-containing protein n=1 Tax=Mytilinidion resinicola TaxID=574789 RepID=A0A6A6Z6M9_9PEZI|nr:uncharacterized protein BDZ99DRAFT_403879 [Mytilinidion resinicola]KAF2816751.1 hypothetical protein BDZ99DRAFT_403879 [Mytilinidion resinicola]
MKYFKSLLLLSLTISLVRADFLASATKTLPECAVKCLVSAVSESTCSVTDAACIAHDKALELKVEGCVKGACTIKEALVTKNFTVSALGSPIRDRTKDVTITGLTGGALALLAVGLRVIARLPCLGGQWGNDDWAILVAMLPVIPLTCLSVVLANDGLGKDLWAVPFEKVTAILHVYYFDEILYLMAIALTKISILFFYLRIFPEKNFRRCVYGVMACCVIYIVGFIPPVIAQCQPINLAWKHWDGEHKGHCINLNVEGWISAAVNIVIDAMVIVLPLQQIAKLKLSRRKKYGLMLMFTLGLFVTVISMLRLKWMIQFANTDNVTWDYVPIGYWSTIEVHIGIICACLPALRALQFRLFPSTAHASQYVDHYYGASKRGHSGYNTQASNASIIRSTAMKSERDKDRTDAREFVPLDNLSVESMNVVLAGKEDRVGETRTLGRAESGGRARIVVRKEYSVAVEDGRGTFLQE